MRITLPGANKKRGAAQKKAKETKRGNEYEL
jgi:hypothetical protein